MRAAGEVLANALPYLERKIHPIVIISAFNRALEDALKIIEEVSIPIDVNDKAQMAGLIKSCIGTKFINRWSDLMCGLALDAVRCVAMEVNGKREVDIKRYARVEKVRGVCEKILRDDVYSCMSMRSQVPGGEMEESCVLDGVMINKDVTHPKMRRYIENPRIVLLDCPLEYKKGESHTDIEVSSEEHWSRYLQIEEEQIQQMCEKIIALKPDLVLTEKGVSGRGRR